MHINFKHNVVFFIFFIAVLCPLWARDVTVVVRDSDLGIPLQGAVVRLSGSGSFVCDEDGAAVFIVPDDRQVQVKILYTGYETESLTIPLNEDRFNVDLHIRVVLENEELVVEAQRPNNIQAKSGRSVAISGEALSQTSEIGLIEDVMSSIRLLPGVGYTSMFSAKPSIRGGDPGDLTAVMDGFYVEQPYHWGGAYSIFVPQMTDSARLSHGVFSGRYGHTISGLLEISSKKPQAEEIQFELNYSTSEVGMSLAYPIGAKGGILAMGKVTFWEPYLGLIKLIAKAVPRLDVINTITKAPYIRDFAITAGYNFSNNLQWSATAFFGSDGVGAEYHNIINNEKHQRDVNLKFSWINYTTFAITRFVYNPRNNMILAASTGLGLYESDLIADIKMDRGPLDEPENIPRNMQIEDTLINTTINYQGRVDYDVDIGHGFLIAAGVHELYAQWLKDEDYKEKIEIEGESDFPLPANYRLNVKNSALNTSAYTLLEYLTPKKIFGVELGMRLDHFYFMGKDFSIQSYPVFNPRLNLDFYLIKNISIVDSLSLTLGSGLFSSINDVVTSIDISNKIENFDLRPNRSWTSVVGTKIDFSFGVSFNIEAYYKHVYDRTYRSETYIIDSPTEQHKIIDYFFNGQGRITGFDFQLQKNDSRFIDGWISYSYNYALYRNPNAIPDVLYPNTDTSRYPLTGNGWYFPSFHRFHNINLILNIKPSKRFHIGTRFGFASGKPVDEDNSKREGFSWPVDIKFSWYWYNASGKIRGEIYLAAENLQSIVYDAQLLSRGNDYTGDEEMSEYKPVYDMPVPMVSFGFKWTY
ncbi:MAG: hypothetical protein Ta2F_14840 [Termitinemataceae bacterium]|nr:MAG: hypothetical protein Ta2F_14840 [Termitinemataceae bacterium]